MMTQTQSGGKGQPAILEEREDPAVADTYQQGYEAGYADGCLIIDNPAGENGHTVERFCRFSSSTKRRS